MFDGNIFSVEPATQETDYTNFQDSTTNFSISSLWKYSDTLDMILLVIGCVTAVAVGIILPVILIYLGIMLDGFNTGTIICSRNPGFPKSASPMLNKQIMYV